MASITTLSAKKEADYTQVSGTLYYYEACFWSGMPDLNFDSETVRSEISDIMKY